MAAKWENEKKIDVARRLLTRVVDSLSRVEGVEMALRVYGHQNPVPPQDCNDTRLEVPFGKNSGTEIIRRLRYYEPRGTTPLAVSLSKAANDFPPAAGKRNVIILITDGIEACDGDPCLVARELQTAGIILKPFIIGVGLDPSIQDSFNCIGNVYNATDEKSFGTVIDIVVTHALTETTLQVNLLDAKGLPNETDAVMTFYDYFTGRLRYNFVHTMNHRGNPDTLYVDPLTDYKVIIHTRPPKTIDRLILTPGKHNVIAKDAPQGSLILNQASGYQYRDLEFLVKPEGQNLPSFRQKMFIKTKYIAGNWDLEIPTLPPTYLKGVVVKPDEITTVSLPQPGLVTLFFSVEGICELFVERDNRIEWIYSVNTSEKSNTLTLLPGEYRIIFRPMYSRSTSLTVEKRFKIESGKSIPLKIF